MAHHYLLLFRFLLALGFWTLAGDAVLTNDRVEASIVVPFSHWQGGLAERYVLGAPLSITVVPGCRLDVVSRVSRSRVTAPAEAALV